MQYLITFSDPTRTPYYTNWHMKNNLWEQGMVVFDLHNGMYSKDNVNWAPITSED